MLSRAAVVVTVVLIAVGSGCASERIQRSQLRYPKLEQDCPVEFIPTRAGFTEADYEVLGRVTMMAPGGWLTDTAKLELRRTACEWGGEAVLRTDSASRRDPEAVTFNVLRRKPTAVSTTPVACKGTYKNANGVAVVIAEDRSATVTFMENVTACTLRARGDTAFTLICGANEMDGSFGPDCKIMSYGGIWFARAN